MASIKHTFIYSFHLMNIYINLSIWLDCFNPHVDSCTFAGNVGKENKESVFNFKVHKKGGCRPPSTLVHTNSVAPLF